MNVTKPPVVVTTKHATPDEERTKRLLEDTLSEHDLSHFIFTNRVQIDEKAVSHSHPVLTLSTRFMVRSLDGMIAEVLHEQLHWYVASHRARAWRANREWRSMYGRVPRAGGGGARTRRSTLLHITVNWLEIEALTRVLGMARSSVVVDEKVDGRVYPWVYRTVRDDHSRIGEVLARVGLADIVETT